MAVESTATTTGPLPADGSATVFNFTFKAASEDEVGAVAYDDDGVEGSLPSFTATLTDSGGSVEFDTAPADGLSIYLTSEPDFRQRIEFEQGSRWLASPVNEANDRSALRDLWLRERLSLLASSAMVSPAARAGKYLAWDAEGDPIVATGTGADAGLRTDLAASGGSALAGFLQSGTGATARTVQSKLRELLSVVDFGADPTGVADSYAAIMAAKAAAEAQRRTLYFPGGSYLTSATLDLAFFEGVILGETKTAIFSSSASVSPVVRFNATDPGTGDPFASLSMRVENLQVYGSQGASQVGVQTIAATTSIFRNIFVRDCGLNGFQIDGSVATVFENCVVATRGHSSIAPDVGFLIQHCQGVTATADCAFINCMVEVADVRGIYLYKCTDSTWIGGTTEGITGVGIETDVASVGNTFIGHFCEANVTNGDVRLRSNGNTFINCVLSSRAVSPPYHSVKSVRIESGAQNNVFRGGRIYAAEVKSGALNTTFDSINPIEYQIENSGTATRIINCMQQNLSGTQFPSMTLGNVVHTDPLALDWYEEGSFTPAFAGSTVAGTHTYDSRSGAFTRIGNRVYCDILLDLATTSGATGGLRITGLPYTAAGNSGISVSYSANVTLPGGATQLTGYSNTNFITLAGLTSAGNLANVDAATLANSTVLALSLSYQVSGG